MKYDLKVHLHGDVVEPFYFLSSQFRVWLKTSAWGYDIVTLNTVENVWEIFLWNSSFSFIYDFSLEYCFYWVN